MKILNRLKKKIEQRAKARNGEVLRFLLQYKAPVVQEYVDQEGDVNDRWADDGGRFHYDDSDDVCDQPIFCRHGLARRTYLDFHKEKA